MSLKQRDARLDIIRCISMVLVIVIHIANYYCRAYHAISHSSFLFAVIYNSITRVAVPMFFMISGALLLSADYNVRKNINRIVSKVITVIGITVIYYFWDRFAMNGKKVSIISLLNSPDRKLLWFMYAIIALYIALPFIKAMVDGLDTRHEIIFAFLWFILCGILTKLKIFRAYPVPVVGDTYYLGYFVVGHIIYKNYEKLRRFKNYLLPLSAVGLVCIVLNTYLKSLSKGMYYDYYFSYSLCYMMILSVPLFLWLLLTLENKEIKAVSLVSKYTFGMYLFHGIILDITMKLLPYTKLHASYGVIAALVIIFPISFLIVYLLKKIPVINRYI